MLIDLILYFNLVATNCISLDIPWLPVFKESNLVSQWLIVYVSECTHVVQFPVALSLKLIGNPNLCHWIVKALSSMYL